MYTHSTINYQEDKPSAVVLGFDHTPIKLNKTPMDFYGCWIKLMLIMWKPSSKQLRGFSGTR